MKFCIVGSGYVGLSLAVLISQKYKVSLLEIDSTKVDLINKKESPIKDREIENYLKIKPLKLTATTVKKDAYKNADYIIVAAPTNYDSISGSFDTKSVEEVVSDSISHNKKATVVIKSTIPFGFTDILRNKFNHNNIFFSPEFLRETSALYDNLHPSRVIVGGNSFEAIRFGEILIECSKKKKTDIKVISMESKEAEAVKLFANTYLAMRIAFFNELDGFSELQNLSTKNIIEGVCLDPRIGNHYNNPSFGYGGYCLPKDTKQLLENFNETPNSLIRAIVESNKTRKDFIVNSIKKKSPSTVGVYRLIMKDGSDNFRESAVLDILDKIDNKKNKVILYEPLIEQSNFNGIKVLNDIDDFIASSDLIIANRMSEDLEHVINKVYSRDIFNEN